MGHHPCFSFFFFNDTATTEIYTLSLHDALPIFRALADGHVWRHGRRGVPAIDRAKDRKSTRLNSSHLVISYAVFCLKKKKNTPSLMHDWTCVNVVLAAPTPLSQAPYSSASFHVR